MSSTSTSWNRFKTYYLHLESLGLSVDISKMAFAEEDLENLKPKATNALQQMQALEQGAQSNPDEGRQVGHYWLRQPSLAPTQVQQDQITQALEQIEAFTRKVHTGEALGQGGTFLNLLVIGIGGSALGPQFVAHALGQGGQDRLKPFFFDNTDPDGMDRVLEALHGQLDRTLAIVISKSGGTKETRNGMLEARQAWEAAGLSFARHAVAVTSDGSQLDQVARQQGWLEVFPMWDWVGGRTSELSAVGLLPAALQGLDIQAMLAGARDCDVATREANPMQNPAALLAMMWYHAGQGKGDKAMVILPYKDRLELFSKYLQQLVMESLGKADDLEGQRVEQGIVVYGNKGSTDQHAYIQQLRDGRNDFFATFLEVLRDRQQVSIEVEPGVTSGDFLQGFLLGTRAALHGNQRESITLTLSEVNPRSVGMLIALYERAVGLYAFMIGINAYHQPGVEAGKKAAGEVIDLQTRLIEHLKSNPSEAVEVESLAAEWGAECDPETLFKICEHLAANPDRGIEKLPGATPFQARYRLNVN